MKSQYLVASVLLFGCLTHSLQADTLQQYIEAETLQGIDGDSWKRMPKDTARAMGEVSGGGAVLFHKGGDVTKPLDAELSRPLGVQEKVKVFCRVLHPVGDQPAWIWVRSGGAEAGFEIQAVADPKARRWHWTAGKILNPPVGGAGVEVVVTGTQGAVALDLIYVTTDLAAATPDRLVEKTRSAIDGDARLREGLTFYIDFEDTLRPLIAKTWPKPVKWNAFKPGIAGKGVYVAKNETPAPPSYPTKGNMPFLKGSLSFWFSPAWDSPKETGQKYLHLLSMYNPGRFYLMLTERGLSNHILLAEAGRYGPHWLQGKLHRYRKFAGREVRLQWKKGEWNHFLFTWNETESHGYLNGKEVGSGGPRPEEAGKDNYFGEILQVGGYQSGRTMNGVVDELAAWDRVLTPQEVKQVHACGRAHVSFLPKAMVERLRSQRAEALRMPEVTVPNVFRNGSFEAGLSNYFYATNPYFSPPKFFPERFVVTDEEARHGKRSLRVTIPAKGTVPKVGHYGQEGLCKIQTFGLQLNPKQTFTFSCWVKKRSGGEIQFSLGCYPVRANPWGGKVAKSLTLPPGETDWQRLVFSSRPEEVPHGYYTLILNAVHRDSGEAVFYLDGIQVSPGEGPAREETFPCRTSAAGTLATPVLANIFKRGKDALQLEVRLANQAAKARETKATLSVYDLFDRKVFERAIAATLAPFQQHAAACALPELAFGSYRAALTSQEEGGIVLDEMPFSVMPDLGRVNCMGVHVFLDAYCLDVAARLGAQWNRLWDGAELTHWSTVQPDGPEFRWELSDANLERILARGFRPLGVLYHVNEWKRSWVTGKRPVWIYEKLGRTNRGRALLNNPEMLARWKEYVYETVKRYKGKIDYWEVLNEPYNGTFGDWSPEEYLDILKVTEGAMRKANPAAKVVAPCTFLLPKWCPPMLKMGLLEHLDVFSYHGYGMKGSALATMRKWSTYDGKDRPCFDTENGCHGASKFFCKSYAGREYSAGGEPLAAAAGLSQSILRARAYGTDVVFQYWMRPYWPYSRYGSILYCDGTPAPSAVAFGITGWMLRGRRERAMLRLGKYVDCALFENPKDASGLAALWDSRPFGGDPESRVVLEPGQVSLDAYDLMGNPRELLAQKALRIIKLHTDPVYLAASSAQTLEAILKNARVVARGEPTYVIQATYQCDAAGRPALRLKMYNNSMDDRSGTLVFSKLPEGFALAQETVPFAVPANRSAVLVAPLAKIPETATHASYTWTATDGRGVRTSGAFTISHLLVKRREGITLDGDLKEWKGLPVITANAREQVVVGRENWKGPDDCSARLRAAWNASGLYFAIEVTDDNFIAPPAPEWRWDSVELFYDTDLYGDWGEESCNSDDFKYSVEAATREVKGFGGPDELNGASIVEKKVRRMEIRVPASAYKLKLSPGTSFGFDIAIDDADVKGRTRKLQILWAGTDKNYLDPSHYGVLVFVK